MPVTIGQIRGEMELRDVSFQLPGRSRRPGTRPIGSCKTSTSTIRARPDRGAVRAQRRRANHHAEPAAALLRSRTQARSCSTAAISARFSRDSFREPFRAGAAGNVSLQRQHPGQHPLRPCRGDDGAGDRRRQGRQRPRLHQPISPTATTPKSASAAFASAAGRNSASASPAPFWPIPTVLLLDEPTSSVEPDSEAAIIAALDRLMAGRTTVLTSHRPSLINQADLVYVIEDGRVTEQAPPRLSAATAGSPGSCARRKKRCRRWMGRRR